MVRIPLFSEEWGRALLRIDKNGGMERKMGWMGGGGERIGGLIEVGRRRGGGGSKDFIKFVTEVLVS